MSTVTSSLVVAYFFFSARRHLREQQRQTATLLKHFDKANSTHTYQDEIETEQDIFSELTKTEHNMLSANFQ